ncbi:unnamed protein product [Prorocentrum cordatum]|uniref:Uncharacterized protein n=1 Tax=Prorocentrum cordatum TaxID=2364126 RepID=A0ABN9TW28_9DINO|nr:unnamed protein product [Polarella glacialis]
MSLANAPAGCVAAAAQARLLRVHALLAELLADAGELLVVLPPGCGAAAPRAEQQAAGEGCGRAREAGAACAEQWRGAACAAGALVLAAAVPGPAPVVGVLLCSVSVPKAVQVGCLVLFVGGVAAALGGELRGRPRLADGAPGASDAEHAALRRVVEESKMQARAGMRAHLQEFLGGHPQARYEEWIADFHPDNVVPPGRDSRGLPSIDRRHYHERSDHRMIWNEHVGDQRRHVSQFSLWLAEEAERAAARAELGWAWPADDEPAPEAEMEALDDVDSTKQLILAGGLPVSVFNQWAQLERMRLVLDAGARRLCIRGSEDRAHQDDGESEESWDVGKMRSRTKGNPALGPDVSAVARLCAGLPVSLQR